MPSDATDTNERVFRNCIAPGVHDCPFYRLSFPKLELQVSIPRGFFFRSSALKRPWRRDFDYGITP